MSLADRSAPAQASFGNISLYTRGGPDVADTRGSSMVSFHRWYDNLHLPARPCLTNMFWLQVQKHAEKLQYAKEQAALAAITGVLPGMSKAVYAVALQELDWDPTLAAQLLLQFQQAKAEQLQDVSKVGASLLQCICACCIRLHMHWALLEKTSLQCVCTDPACNLSFWARFVACCCNINIADSIAHAQNSFFGCRATSTALLLHGTSSFLLLPGQVRCNLQYQTHQAYGITPLTSTFLYTMHVRLPGP